MKMENIKYLLFLFIITLFVYSCSSSVPEIKEIEEKKEDIYSDGLRINVKQIYSWVNKMPGSKKRFHITGNIEILEDPKYNIDDLSIMSITIQQSNETIYEFTPKTVVDSSSTNKTILFSTVRGLLYSTRIDVYKNIDVKMILSDSANEFYYDIPNVKIEEVY